MRQVTLGLLTVLVALAVPARSPAQEGYPPEVVERYYECVERTDLAQVKELIWYHHNVARVDASIYGLPADDLDDRQPLTIEERLAYRASQAASPEPLATSGPVQYPHFLRHALDNYYVTTGARPDCHAILGGQGGAAELPKDLQNGWASDLNVTSTDTRDRGEVNLAVDPVNPNRLIVTSVPHGTPAENSSFKAVSTDYGQTWARGEVGLNAGSAWECDPVSFYQASTGKLFHAKIACVTGACATYQVKLRKSTDGGTTFSDCATRPGDATKEDREWITVDNTPSSACYGTLYATWHFTNSEKVTRSTDGCATWDPLTTVSPTLTTITADLNPAADGHMYLLYHYYGTPRSFRVVGSSDCGVTWNAPAETTIRTKFAAVSTTAISQCDRGISNQVAVDVDRAPGSQFYGRVYAAMFDMNGSGCYGASTWTCAQWDASWASGCNWDVFFSYSDDQGATWHKPSDGTAGADNLTAADGNNVDQILGFMRVDPADGSVYLAYHRSRLAPASAADRQKTNYLVVRSTDGGSTWEPPVQASTLEGDERTGYYSAQWERGDYQGIDVRDGVAWPVWVDRRGLVTGSSEEIVTRKLCSEPAHWSERAPTFTPPAVSVSGETTVTVGWTAPDLYWGDGGENPGARKYQLWVDGVMVEDNIPADATSTEYLASAGTHTYVVRAVNQCGVYKDYAGVAFQGPGIFADGFETGATGAWSSTSP